MGETGRLLRFIHYKNTNSTAHAVHERFHQSSEARGVLRPILEAPLPLLGRIAFFGLWLMEDGAVGEVTVGQTLVLLGAVAFLWEEKE